MKNFIVATMLLLLFCTQAYATQYIVWRTNISIYIQAESFDPDNAAHLIQVNAPMYNGGSHPWCGQRAYIAKEDTQLVKAAMMANAIGGVWNIIYEDAHANKVAHGHQWTQCRVISIFR